MRVEVGESYPLHAAGEGTYHLRFTRHINACCADDVSLEYVAAAQPYYLCSACGRSVRARTAEIWVGDEDVIYELALPDVPGALGAVTVFGPKAARFVWADEEDL